MPALQEVNFPTTDTLAESEEFLAQLTNNEDASTIQQLAPDSLMEIFHTWLGEGGSVVNIIDQMKEQAVQKALANAALKQPIKRKAAHMYDNDASTLTSQPEAGADKRRFFLHQ